MIEFFVVLALAIALDWPLGRCLAAVMRDDRAFGLIERPLYQLLRVDPTQGNGSINAMHDSLAPLTGLLMMNNVLVKAIWGSIG